ncbi:TPA: hypothetical protein ACXE9A_000857, partial [Enterobacter cloacae]
IFEAISFFANSIALSAPGLQPVNTSRHETRAKDHFTSLSPTLKDGQILPSVDDEVSRNDKTRS